MHLVSNSDPADFDSQLDAEPTVGDDIPKVWDPFGRRRYLERETIAAPKKAPLELSDWTRKLFGKAAGALSLAAIFLLLGTLILAFFSKESAAIVGACAIVSGGLVALLQYLLDDSTYLHDRRYCNLAEQKNWAYAKVGRDQEGRHQAFPPGHNFLKPLTLPRFGQPIPLIPAAEFLG